MLTAAVCNEQGFTPTVMVLRRSDPVGAFWLRDIPLIFHRKKFDSSKIFVHTIGTSENYMKKQWGDDYKNHESSFPVRGYPTVGYDPRILSLNHAKKILKFHHKPIECSLTDQDLLLLARPNTIVFYTFPSDKSFFKYSIDVPLLSKLKIASIPSDDYDYRVTYDGTPDSILSRHSNLFGTMSFELRKFPEVTTHNGEVKIYGEWMRYREIYEISPEAGNLDPLPPGERVIPVGRLACWRRKMLASEVMHSVKKELERFGYA